MSDASEAIEFVRPRSAHNAPIYLADPDPGWARDYQEQAARVRAALPEGVVALEHVGSTSVPGLTAKPVIDMLLLVADPTDEASYVPALEAAGFLLYLREPGWHQHPLFRRANPAANLHVFGSGSQEADRMLLFRDRLRSHPEERELYLGTKRELAARTWERVQDYADAKAEVVEQIIARAREELGK